MANDEAKAVPGSKVPAPGDAVFDLFAQALAHDLRAPLRAIGGFSEVLLESPPGELEPLARQYLPRIAAASTRMAQLLDDLLEWARTANAPFAPQDDTDASSIAEGIIGELRASQPGREVEIAVQAGCLVRADPALLRVALQRLLSNAWKFTTEISAPRIELGIRREEKHSVLWIRDNGAGFDPEQGHRLFQPLQRLHRADQFAGSGVGLAIVKRVVDRHNGMVWAEASENGGACFSLALPVLKASAPSP